MLELKIIRRDILSEAELVRAAYEEMNADSSVVDRSVELGRVSGLLEAIDMINERIKEIDKSKSINWGLLD
tara:strand:+ start:394 stop:606 length:213 start_codon:yes stop_codon:yes gene_type:complete